MVSVSFDVCFICFCCMGGYNVEDLGYLSLVIRSLNDIKCGVLYALVRQDIHVFNFILYITLTKTFYIPYTNGTFLHYY